MENTAGSSAKLPSSQSLQPLQPCENSTSTADNNSGNAAMRNRNDSPPTAAPLPSPALMPSDPPPTPLAESPLSRERAVSSPSKGVPTPDPSSSDSQSDAELSVDPTVSAGASERNATPPTIAVPETRSRSNTKTSNPDAVRRLSASKIQELTSAPGSLSLAAVADRSSANVPRSAGAGETSQRLSAAAEQEPELPTGRRDDGTNPRAAAPGRSAMSARTLSSPPTNRRKSASQPPTQQATRRNSFHPAPRPPPLDLDARTAHPPTAGKAAAPARSERPDSNPPSPIPPSIPLPPMSIPTLLQLELAAQRPSPLYIHHSYTNDIPYESSAVKFERLKNFLLLPWFLERAMSFGVLACLDAWLWTFTVLPMRFCIAASMLVRWWGHVISKEIRWIVGFVWYGLGRMWQRGRRGRSVSTVSGRGATRTEQSRSRSRARQAANGGADASSRPHANSGPHRPNAGAAPSGKSSVRPSGIFRHRRTQSNPSDLTSFHKADLLQGAIILCTSVAVMNLDASRMYHLIRAQSAIKLYAIYNLLEVGDRLLSALGQDIYECLFSSETLSRNSSGRSKVMLPLGMFLLSLVYNILHCVVLFYQVIALNVAVNSYSNALLTLLLSNQFVEIKSTVFKRFEKENTFQLACADIVERFQLWIMLVIIGMRNVVEVGGLSVPGAGSEDGGPGGTPAHSASILPASFTIMPSWLWSGEVLSPFIVVIGSEMVVDWIKHAYVNKFNNIKPNFYGRILDILCKDYYTNVSFVSSPPLAIRLLTFPERHL